MPLESFTVATAWVDCPTERLLLFSVTVTDATGVGALALVTADATFDKPPNLALTLSVPWKGTSWKLYVVDGESPRTVQVSFAPIAVPASGVVHVPDVTLEAEPHEIGATA